MASIFSLYGNIFVENEQANKKIEETTNKGKKSAQSFGESFTKVATSAVKIGTAVVGTTTAIVGGMMAAANNTATTADEIDKASIRMGVSYKSYQELAYAAGQCGVEMTVMEKAAKKLEGTDLSMDDAMQQVMSMATAEERASKAAELFGDTIAYSLSPLIEQSSEDYDGLIQRANDLGLIMGDDAVKAGVTFGDTLSDVKQSFSAIYNQVVSAFMPLLTDVLDLIIEGMPQITDMVKEFAPLLTDMLKQILPPFIQLAKSLLPPIIRVVKALIPPLANILSALLPPIVQLLDALLPPFAELIEVLLPPLMQILDALMPILVPIIELLVEMLNLILPPIIENIKFVANIISTVLVGALKVLTPVVEGVKTVFSTVFGALVGIVKEPINFIISGINSFISGLNKIQIPDWVPAVGGKGLDIPLIKKLRVGMEYVPYDEMPALLHKGEMVLTKDEASNLRKSENKEEIVNNNFNNTINIEKLEVREESDIKRIAEELYYLQKKAVV